MLEEIIKYAIPFLVVMLIGISKAGFAGGTGLIATPLLCLVMKPSQAVAVLLPILCASDWFSLFCYWKTFAWKPLLLCLPGAILGIIIGSFLLKKADENLLKTIVGSIALFFVIYRVVQLILKDKRTAWRPGPLFGTIFGCGCGSFSTLAHAAGPIMAAYLLPQQLGRRFYVGTTVVFFTIVNHLKLIPYWYIGKLQVANLKESLLLLPLVPLGVWTGVWLNKRTSEKGFLIIVYSLLFITGLKLVGFLDILRYTFF